jgi:peptide/nickel transport system permease protein
MSSPVHGETYLSIVWRQFRKNSAAVTSLWLLVPVFFIAIIAPVLASNQPFYFTQGTTTIYPWFRALFNASQGVDHLFNMALVALVPWIVVAVITDLWMRRKGAVGLARGLVIVGELILLTGIVIGIVAIPNVRPVNRYRDRNFPVEEFEANKAGSEQRISALYPPLPFGLYEQDIEFHVNPPGSSKPAELARDSNDAFMHILGTDDTGRDVLVEMIYGTRISMTIGLFAVSIYVTLGVLLGATAGYFGGWVDILISRTIEVVMVFPSFFLILILVNLIGPSIFVIMFVIGITSWTSVARLTRGEVLKQRALDYTAAAKTTGASSLRILLRHILPNSLSPALVAAPFGIAGAIMTEAALSLLGFGLRPPAPSWGTLLKLGSENYRNWWLIVIPSLGIFFCVTIFNLVGNGLRDAMDPKLRS